MERRTESDRKGKKSMNSRIKKLFTLRKAFRFKEWLHGNRKEVKTGHTNIKNCTENRDDEIFKSVKQKKETIWQQ